MLTPKTRSDKAMLTQALLVINETPDDNISAICLSATPSAAETTAQRLPYGRALSKIKA